jgi:hypothetical protein
MFQGVKMPSLIIFCIVGIEKSDLDKVACNVFSRRMVLRTRNLPSERLKNDFLQVDVTMFQGVEIPCKFIFCILGIVKSDLDEGT